MRINIHADGFDLSPRMRALVEARLRGALWQFRGQIELVRVHLHTRVGRHEPDTTSCEVTASLRPTGEVRVRIDEPEMQASVDRAAEAIRVAIERELRLRTSLGESLSVTRVTEGPSGNGALEIVLDGNSISQQQREMLERPEHYLRPVRVREYWRPPDTDEDTFPEELAHALTGR
jgi:ribosome-associated translation inhibitor RaiA